MRTLMLATLLLWAGTAGAQTRICVLARLNPLGIEAQEATRVQRWLAAALSGVPGYRLLISNRIERLMDRDCEGDLTCLAAAGRRVGAEQVVAGDVGSLDGAYMVYLRLVQNDGKQVRVVNGVLDPRGRGLRDAARELAFRLLMPHRFTGSLNVTVDVSNAWIYLDGRRVATSGNGRLEHVTVGTHALRVTHPAYRDFVRFVKVGFSQTSPVTVKLSAFPVETGEMKLVLPGSARPYSDSELPWYRRWWAVAGFGAVVLAATTTAVALLANRSISSDSEVTVRP